MTKQDKLKLDRFNIAHIFDYRDADEVQTKPDYVGNSIYHNLPALENIANLNTKVANQNEFKRLLKTVTTEEAKGLKEDFVAIYRALPFDNKAYLRTLNSLDDGKPILFHCSAGKDRTGVGAALILLALGADKEDIIENYLLSNVYRLEINKKIISIVERAYHNPVATDLMESMFYVKREFIETAINAIYDKYPTFEDYLFQEYQITPDRIEKWKKFYLEDYQPKNDELTVAVVLGNRMNDNQTMSEIMLKRLAMALKMNKEMHPDYIIVSGGIANKKAGISEAYAMAKYLIEHGIDSDRIILEDKSKTTCQNAKFSIPIAITLGVDKIVLCTSKEHLERKFLNPIKLFKHYIGKAPIKLVSYSE